MLVKFIHALDNENLMSLLWLYSYVTAHLPGHEYCRTHKYIHTAYALRKFITDMNRCRFKELYF